MVPVGSVSPGANERDQERWVGRVPMTASWRCGHREGQARVDGSDPPGTLLARPATAPSPCTVVRAAYRMTSDRPVFNAGDHRHGQGRRHAHRAGRPPGTVRGHPQVPVVRIRPRHQRGGRPHDETVGPAGRQDDHGDGDRQVKRPHDHTQDQKAHQEGHAAPCRTADTTVRSGELKALHRNRPSCLRSRIASVARCRPSRLHWSATCPRSRTICAVARAPATQEPDAHSRHEKLLLDGRPTGRLGGRGGGGLGDQLPATLDDGMPARRAWI